MGQRTRSAVTKLLGYSYLVCEDLKPNPLFSSVELLFTTFEKCSPGQAIPSAPLPTGTLLMTRGQ